MLTNDEIALCRAAFEKFDEDRSGTIDLWELRNVLAFMSMYPSEEELFQMLAEVDDNDDHMLEFTEFLKLIENQRRRNTSATDSADTLDAFVALGGRSDRTGQISTDKLRAAIMEFELPIDVDKLIEEADEDKSGFIDYVEFAQLLSESPSSAVQTYADVEPPSGPASAQRSRSNSATKKSPAGKEKAPSASSVSVDHK